MDRRLRDSTGFFFGEKCGLRANRSPTASHLTWYVTKDEDALVITLLHAVRRKKKITESSVFAQLKWFLKKQKKRSGSSVLLGDCSSEVQVR